MIKLIGIKVILDKCNGCEACIKVCTYNAVKVVEKKAIIESSCTLCGACVSVCKQEAIIIETHKEKADTRGYQGVWVLVEQRHGEVAPVVYELLGEGRKLADRLEVELQAVLLGHQVKDEAKDLITYGADAVYLFDDPFLDNPREDVYARVVVDLVDEHKPEIILAGATSFGRSLLPQLATILKTGLTADCTGLEIDSKDKLLLQTRPAFGGNIMATIICPNNRPQMATVRPHVMKKGVRDEKRKGKIIEGKISKNIKSRLEFIDFIRDETERINIGEANIIVSGGRGLGKPENFKLIEELADVLGAAVGASRAAVDAGWIPYSHQVGQTGKTVCPKLYIACGISGAIQHLAGMQTSDVIVAINKDPQAPIFDVATYGIVGDLFEVVPRLIKELKQELGR